MGWGLSEKCELWGPAKVCSRHQVATIKSYKWMSYIPSQNLQIAANFASFDGGDDDQMLEMDVLESWS